MIRAVTINVKERVKKINISGRLLEQEPMKSHTTFGIGGPADWYYIPDSFSDLRKMLQLLSEAEIPYSVIGRGSNVLVSDKGFRGCILDMKNFSDYSIRGLYVTAQAGTQLHALINSTAERGLSGFEQLAGIPGSVGGAICTNAGSYGADIGSLAEWVDWLAPDGRLCRSWKDEQLFSYRTSAFTDSSAVITEAGFRLSPDNSTTILKKIDKVRKEKIAAGHYAKASAGSIFRNPPDLEITAGELIDSLNLKGTALGDAAVSPKHGNIIMNNGAASAQDVLELVHSIQQQVRTKTGIQLEMEIHLLGDWNDES